VRSLTEEIDEYSEELQKGKSAAAQEGGVESLQLFKQYLDSAASGAKLGPDLLLDFLGRWHVETAASQRLHAPAATVRAVREFVKWLDRRTHESALSDCISTLDVLEQSLPRALRIAEELSRDLAARGGAFTFPEFLTTFAEGGQSRYDIDVAGEGQGPSGMEGYFRVVRVEGTSAELEDMISEDRAWPVKLPTEVARLLEPDWILNLEIVRSGNEWQVAACGFAYPPGVEFSS